MKLTLIGYGKMGKEIEKLALAVGYEVVNCFDEKTSLTGELLADTVCLDFTNAWAFGKNFKLIADHCLAAVVGTTGWEDIEQEVFDNFLKNRKTLVYASNFSIGANIYFSVVERAAKLNAYFGEEYEPYIVEMHHCGKLDRPSGTAKELSKIINSYSKKSVIEPLSIRCGSIRGIHEVGFESIADKVTIRHEAYSREGFARGALLAAKAALENRGVFKFRDLIDKMVLP